MRRIGTAWRIACWMLLIAWIPVLAECGCAEVFPHFEERFPSTILVIPYMEFISMPLTLMVILIVLYKSIKALFRLGRRSGISH